MEQINTNTTYGSYFWVQWSQDGDQDIQNNRTKIVWTCGVYCGHSFYLNAIRMSPVIINGTQVYGGGTYSDFDAGNHTIATGKMWIEHNSDGTKTFSISPFTGWLYSNYNYSSNGSSFELKAIPRKAMITSAPDFTDVDNPTISFSNPGGFDNLHIWLEPNPTGEHLCERAKISNTGTYTWELTDEERTALRNKCTGKECTIRFGLCTYINGKQNVDYQDKKFTMTENDDTKPEVEMRVELKKGDVPDAFADLYIQGKSKVDITLTATGKYGATIQKYSATVDGKTYNSDVIQKSGEVLVVGYATDSRGFTGTAEQTINVIEYGKPLVVPLDGENAIHCYRSDEKGNRVGNSKSIWLKAKKTCSSVNNLNSCALQWRMKKASSVWEGDEDGWQNLISAEFSETAYNALISGVTFEKEKAYTVQIRAIDTIGEYDRKTFDIPTQDVAMHLGAGGKNVTIGDYCDCLEDYTFRSAWKAIFDKEVIIEGRAVDRIVKEGTDGIWTYEKWSNGKAVCWGILGADEVISSGTTTMGDTSVGYKTLFKVFPGSLFVSTPVIFATANDSGGGVVSVANEQSTNYQCQVVIFGTSEAIGTVNVYAIGQWDQTNKEEE